MAGLFDTFTIAKRGLNVQQANINTTSHNISNASTVGYSRQRAVIETTKPFGGMSRFDSTGVGQVGTGAEVTTIQRIRDVFKDYQVRNQMTENGKLETQNEYLTQIEDILNETSDTGIQDALSKFYSAFQSLSLAPEKLSNRTVAIQQASVLANALNNRYTQLETKKSDAQAVLGNDVSEVNSILDQINELNKQITGVSAVGMAPNDLMDKRDNLLDQLSTKFGITTQREKYESLDVNTTLSDGTKLNLVDGKDLTGANCNRLSYVDSAELVGTTLTVTYAVLGDKKNMQTLTITGADEALKNDLLQTRILVGDKDGNLTPAPTTAAAIKSAMCKVEKGEIGGNQSVQNDIQTSMDELDKFAAGLAYAVNAIQTGTTDAGIVDGDPGNLKLSNDEPLFVTKASNGTALRTDTGINAKNITINSVIEKDATKLNCGATAEDISGDKAGTRALAIANVLSLKMDLTKINVTATSTRDDFFNGTPTNSGVQFESATDELNLKSSTTGATLDNFYKGVISTLATKAKEVSSDLTNTSGQLESFQNDRLSESGVSLDEETANLIQYQHAYQANAKVISTVDELLDVVINGLKR